MIAVVGLFIGIILGFVFDVNIPEGFSSYMSIAILACLDSVFGAIRANLSKRENTRRYEEQHKAQVEVKEE